MSSFVDGTQAYTYSSFASKCEELSALLASAGVGQGDKVAILSENMPSWTAAFFSATAFGRVVVPILPDCSANEVTNILTHSGSKALFVSERCLSKLTQECREKLDIVVCLNTFETIRFLPAEPALMQDAAVITKPGDLAAIIYTSGTSGKAKGVMVSHRALCHNIAAAPDVQVVTPEDVFMSVLPMAHTYEMSLSMLYPFTCGAKVYYMNKVPTPTALLAALATVRPTMMCSVPLIIEKIYRKSVLPTIQHSPLLSWMRKHMPSLMWRIIGLKLRKTFGGRLKAFAIGGAKLDSEVEAFLKASHFPYAIGYGMTEMAPLICAVGVNDTAVGTTGPALYGVEIKLGNPDPATGEGEIMVKGPNLMLGYYKDPERTAEAITKDGWLHTKDVAIVDEKGRYFIKGRLGNMILGASGENIYPEEIEMVINSIETVEESIVTSIDGRLVAIVKLNGNVLDWNLEGEQEFVARAENLKRDILAKVNKAVNKASQLSAVRLIREPFEKTASQKIRRFLYVKG